MKRFLKYFNNALKYGSRAVQYVFQNALYTPGSVISTNVKYICDEMNANFCTKGTDFKVVCSCTDDEVTGRKAAFIRELVMVRDSGDQNDMSLDDVKEMIEYISMS